MDLQVDEKPKKLPGSDNLASMRTWKHTIWCFTIWSWTQLKHQELEYDLKLWIFSPLKPHVLCSPTPWISTCLPPRSSWWADCWWRFWITTLYYRAFRLPVHLQNFQLLSPQVSECRHLAELANLPPAQLRRASRVGGRSLQDVLREFQVSWATSFFPSEFIPDNQDIVDAITEIAETIPGEGEELRWLLISE